jgi:class 3 adenylate cyclase
MGLNTSRLDADIGAGGEMRFARPHRRDADRDLSGRKAGRRVLKGLIRRGVADRISAVLWYSDLREFTRITDQSP